MIFNPTHTVNANPAHRAPEWLEDGRIHDVSDSSAIERVSRVSSEFDDVMGAGRLYRRTAPARECPVVFTYTGPLGAGAYYPVSGTTVIA